MNKVLEFHSAGGTVVVESSEVAGAAVRGGSVSSLVQKVEKSFDESVGVVRPIAEAVIAQFAGLSRHPDTVELEFALKFSAGLGAVIAATSAEGSLKVRLVWKPGSTGTQG